MNKMCRTNAQGGRSMIEMLGVLAIIGVLSVGGIAGYSKAMMKFKINKTIDQITQLSQNIRVLYARQKNYARLDDKIIYKANLAPREMFEGTGSEDGHYGMSHPFGGYVFVNSAGRKNGYDEKAFVIALHDLPEEACIELATQDWGSDASSGLLAVGIDSGEIFGALEGCEGNAKYACPNGKNVSTPMPVDVAVSACECPSGFYNCDFSLKFY